MESLARGGAPSAAMQQEMDALVFRPSRTPAAAAPAPSPTRASPPPEFLQAPVPHHDGEQYDPDDAYLIKPYAVGEEKHVHPTHLFAGKGTEDHFVHQTEMVLDSDETDVKGPHGMPGMVFDSIYSEAHTTKDTDDHFGDGMNMSDENPITNAFDRVYDSRFEGKDTESSFEGMQIGSAAVAREEARRIAQMKKYDAAKKALEKTLAEPERMHMGHEQFEGKGDTEDHFAGGSMLVGKDVDTSMPFDRVYDSRYDGVRAQDHFASHGMALVDEADTGNTFDRVFGTQHEAKHSASHFQSGMSIGPQGLSIQQDQKFYPKLTKAEMFPPRRNKFLHDSKPFTAEMQAHIDSIAIKVPAGGKKGEPSPTRQASRKSMISESVPTTPKSLGSGSAAAERIDALAPSQKSFAWDSGRIAHELVCKFDQFTRRREDHMRKLLWTFGSDPCFESANNRNSIHVSPSNFNRVCDRFGLVCNEGQAREIFNSYQLPSEGCNLYTLAKKFIDTNESTMAKPGRLGHMPRPPSEPRPSAPDPFKLARMCDNAWRDHRVTGAAAAPFAVTLPPINAKSS